MISLANKQHSTNICIYNYIAKPFAQSFCVINFWAQCFKALLSEQTTGCSFQTNLLYCNTLHNRFLTGSLSKVGQSGQTESGLFSKFLLGTVNSIGYTTPPATTESIFPTAPRWLKKKSLEEIFFCRMACPP